jgi:hypothetical protein
MASWRWHSVPAQRRKKKSPLGKKPESASARPSGDSGSLRAKFPELRSVTWRWIRLPPWLTHSYADGYVQATTLLSMLVKVLSAAAAAQ